MTTNTVTLKKHYEPTLTALANLPVINLSGINPTEFNVLVRDDPTEDTITTASGIKLYKPIDTTEKEKNAAQSGLLVAVSPLAFSYERWPENVKPPQAGQRVVFAKYAGMIWKGKDGVEYRLLKDKDLVATLS